MPTILARLGLKRNTTIYLRHKSPLAKTSNCTLKAEKTRGTYLVLDRDELGMDEGLGGRFGFTANHHPVNRESLKQCFKKQTHFTHNAHNSFEYCYIENFTSILKLNYIL